MEIAGEILPNLTARGEQTVGAGAGGEGLRCPGGPKPGWRWGLRRFVLSDLAPPAVPHRPLLSGLRGAVGLLLFCGRGEESGSHF